MTINHITLTCGLCVTSEYYCNYIISLLQDVKRMVTEFLFFFHVKNLNKTFCGNRRKIIFFPLSDILHPPKLRIREHTHNGKTRNFKLEELNTFLGKLKFFKVKFLERIWEFTLGLLSPTSTKCINIFPMYWRSFNNIKKKEDIYDNDELTVFRCGRIAATLYGVKIIVTI